LQVLQQGEFAVLYWSSAFPGFELEASAVMAPFPIWEPVSAKPERTGAYFAVAVPMASPAQLFRLRKE
jgi:hypothetical protein